MQLFQNKNLSVWHFNVFYIYLYIMQTCTLHILRKPSEFKASKNNEYLKTSYCQLFLYKISICFTTLVFSMLASIRLHLSMVVLDTLIIRLIKLKILLNFELYRIVPDFLLLWIVIANYCCTQIPGNIYLCFTTLVFSMLSSIRLHLSM